MIELFYTPRPTPARVAILMSGEGGNAEAVLEYRHLSANPSFDVAVVMTDRVHVSRAREIAGRWQVPFVGCDIADFYAANGQNSVSLKTGRGRELREAWTEQVRQQIAPFKVDFLVLAGFFSLCNITRDYPSLNIHPGDLTYEENGRRALVGLNAIPVEAALLRALPYLRSSVILAQPYTGDGDGEMDSGPVLGVSEPMNIAPEMTVREMRAIRERRVRGEKVDDPLRSLAEALQVQLKHFGDLTVFPRVIADFAAGCFGHDGAQLLYRGDTESEFKKIRSVEYARQHKKLLF